VFYEGRIADTIARFMKREGGYLTLDDLASHTSDWVDPVSVSYRGYDIWELPPTVRGSPVLEMLNILEGYDIGAMGFGSAAHLHAFVEAKNWRSKTGLHFSQTRFCRNTGRRVAFEEVWARGVPLSLRTAQRRDTTRGTRR